MKLNARELELQALRVRKYEAAQALKRALDAKDEAAAAAQQPQPDTAPAPKKTPAKKPSTKSRRSRASSRIGRSRGPRKKA